MIHEISINSRKKIGVFPKMNEKYLKEIDDQKLCHIKSIQKTEIIKKVSQK